MDLSRLEDLQNDQTVVSDHQKGFRRIAKIECCIEFKISKCETQNVDRMCGVMFITNRDIQKDVSAPLHGQMSKIQCAEPSLQDGRGEVRVIERPASRDACTSVFVFVPSVSQSQQ